VTDEDLRSPFRFCFDAKNTFLEFCIEFLKYKKVSAELEDISQVANVYQKVKKS
jgi:hypothetical protein